jgi:hypothetical protein
MDETGSKDMQEPPLPPKQRSRRPRWPIPLALLGVLGLVLAAILGSTNRGRSELPSNYNAVRQFNGTAQTVLNPAALQAGNFGDAFIANTPVTGQSTVRVVDTSGNSAKVLDEQTMTAGGTDLGTTSNTYAVDRNSLEPATNPPSSWNAQPHQGLAVAFPAGAAKQDYTGWVSDTQTTVPLRYLREESRGGVNTYVYQADVAPAPVRDQAVLASLPSSISRAALQGLMPQLPITADQRSALTQALPGLPDDVPMSYTVQGSQTFWVEPTTGQIVDTQRSVTRTGAIGGPGGATLATLPVYNVNTAFTSDSVAAAGREAADRRNTLTSAGRVWPWILGTLGALALLAGLLGMLMRRRPQAVPQVPEPTYPPTETSRRRETTYRPTGNMRGPAEEGRRREAQPGKPQPPYAGKTPHKGPYREPRAGQTPPHPHEHEPDEEQFPTRGQPGQYPGQPPQAGG